MERILKLTIEAGLRTRTITPKQMQVVVVDTTVQPKAVEHPTDARLFRKVLHHLLRVGDYSERLAMTCAVMEARGALDQVRVQSANSE